MIVCQPICRALRVRLSVPGGTGACRRRRPKSRCNGGRALWSLPSRVFANVEGTYQLDTGLNQDRNSNCESRNSIGGLLNRRPLSRSRVLTPSGVHARCAEQPSCLADTTRAGVQSEKDPGSFGGRYYSRCMTASGVEVGKVGQLSTKDIPSVPNYVILGMRSFPLVCSMEKGCHRRVNFQVELGSRHSTAMLGWCMRCGPADPVGKSGRTGHIGWNSRCLYKGQWDYGEVGVFQKVARKCHTAESPWLVGSAARR